MAALFGLPGETITSRIGVLPDHLPMPALPETSLARLQELLLSALIIAFLPGAGSLLPAMVADLMLEGWHRPNTELTAQGAASIGSSLFGGLPATGAIARTATHVKAIGKTPVARLVHALAILLLVLTRVLTAVADFTAAIGVGVALGLALRFRRRARRLRTGRRRSIDDRLVFLV